MKISREEVEKLAQHARLEFSEKEIEDMRLRSSQGLYALKMKDKRMFPFSLSFLISLGLQGSPCASLLHYRCASRTLHTWGLLSQKLKLFIWASCPTHVLYFRMYLFSPLYASI